MKGTATQNIHKNKLYIRTSVSPLLSVLKLVLLLAAISCSDSSTGNEPDPEPQPVFGTIEVQVVTTGEDDDPDGYTISVEGGESKDIGPNGTVIFTQVIAGNKTVTLSGIPGHCMVEGTPSEAFTLGDSEVRTIEYEVSCTAIFRDKILFMKSTGEDYEYQIYSISPSGENERMVNDVIVLSSASPSISPDGLRVAFARTEATGQEAIQQNYQIWMMNADGSGLENITNNPSVHHTYPEWSPDGSKIALSRTSTTPSDIYMMNDDGSGMTNLTNSSMTDVNPSWSPDGSRIVFVSFRTKEGNVPVYSIKSMNADGSDIQTLMEGENIVLDNPIWSPNGDLIAFERFAIEGNEGPRQVYLMNTDGSNLRKIFDETNLGNATSFGPSWSPDGRKFAFTIVETNANTNILTLDINDYSLNVVTNGTNLNHLYPSWSPYTRN